MSRYNFFLFFTLVALLPACSSTKVATSRFQHNFDFTAINSYSTYQRDSKFSEYQNMSDGTRNSIELAIEQVFDKSGFVYRTINEADVVIGYHLVGRNSKELVQYNKGVKYCQPCLSGGKEKLKKTDWRYTPGSLILDVINSKNSRSIWRSVYPLKIEKEDNSKDIQDKIYAAIEQMLKAFPVEKKLTAFQPPQLNYSPMPQLAIFN